MRDVIFDRIFDRHFSYLSSGVQPGFSRTRPETGERDRSGTTIIGFHYKDGIMLAADRKTTEGWLGIKSLESIKIYQVDPFTGALFAGMVGDIQYTLKKLVNMAVAFRSNYEYMLTIAGQVNFLTTLFRDYMDFLWPLEVVVIIAGRNSRGGLDLWEVNLDGSKYKHELYAAEGSGGPAAGATLYEARKLIRDRSLTFDQAMALALRSIYKSGVNDNFSSDLRIAYPKIAIITPDKGFSFIEDSVVKQTSDRVISEEGAKDV